MDVEFERIELQMSRLRDQMQKSKMPAISDLIQVSKISAILSSAFVSILGSEFVQEAFESSCIVGQLKELTGLPACALRDEVSRYPLDLKMFLEEVKCGGELYHCCRHLAAVLRDDSIEIGEVGSLVVETYDIELDNV